ncbi:hypothetical protein SAMN05421803_11348 [Nocardiopsis flavescens]|uniref:Uncharacterized protein n=1 Tax=Nocardiopsis flavescens TaxID=758803 RepID=A0A1M6PEQ4_9ACTN|nr:hypothetical protein [Nocardiopsis flavescens]SHK06372.1 hypothetical protein SAMN05421803_11348 [Nocardiopsis flavescens]
MEGTGPECTPAARALLMGGGPARPYWPHVPGQGWVSDGGALLLRALLRSYHGRRSAFGHPADYESAVNGRGVPDDGTGDPGVLLRRGTAFARSVLAAAERDVPGRSVTARISVAPVLDSPQEHTGYVTFASSRYAGERLRWTLEGDGPVVLLRGPGV